MVETIIMLLIQICILVAVVYIVIWVLGIIGVSLPERVIQIFWVIVALVVLLLLFRVLMGGGNVLLWR